MYQLLQCILWSALQTTNSPHRDLVESLEMLMDSSAYPPVLITLGSRVPGWLSPHLCCPAQVLRSRNQKPWNSWPGGEDGKKRQRWEDTKRRFGKNTWYNGTGSSLLMYLVVGDIIYIYIYLIYIHQIGYTVYVRNSVYVHATAKWCGLSTRKPWNVNIYIYISFIYKLRAIAENKILRGLKFAIFRVCGMGREIQKISKHQTGLAITAFWIRIFILKSKMEIPHFSRSSKAPRIATGGVILAAFKPY